MVYNNILEAMGHTPIVKLNHLVTPDMARILVNQRGRLHQNAHRLQHDLKG